MTVGEILEDVKARGARAVRDWAVRLDGEEPARAEATECPEDAVLALADAVRRWHALQRPADVRAELAPGVELERRWVPLESVGIYVPRGLVSTLVMTVVPAQAAGVDEIVVCTPPSGAGSVAAAARLLGVDDVVALGGPVAIGWLAYVRRVAKIVGPGGGFTNEAKLLVARDVAIDLPAGPSEIVVLAERGAGDGIVELELAAQAEHAGAVVRAVELDGDADAALAKIEAFAPEHVFLLGPRAEALAPRIRNAGSVFVGAWSSVAAGDYATGANHVLPTGGFGRAFGGLGLETFLKPITVQRLTRDGLARLRPTVEALAACEGLPAHAEAVRR